MEPQQDPLTSLPPAWQDILKEHRRAEAADKELAEAFSLLIKHPAWDRYYKLLAKIVENIGTGVLEPITSQIGVLKQEYDKGTMKGVLLARDLPSIIIQQMTATPASEDEE